MHYITPAVDTGPYFSRIRMSIRALHCVRVAKNRGGDKSIATPDGDSFSVYFHMEMLAFVSWQWNCREMH